MTMTNPITITIEDIEFELGDALPEPAPARP